MEGLSIISVSGAGGRAPQLSFAHSGRPAWRAAAGSVEPRATQASVTSTLRVEQLASETRAWLKA